MKYAWITNHRDSFPVVVMCDVLNVSCSGYYDSLDRQPSARAERHERLKQTVQQVHAESHGIYGSRKIAEVMQQREDLESACRNTVTVASGAGGAGWRSLRTGAVSRAQRMWRGG